MEITEIFVYSILLLQISLETCQAVQCSYSDILVSYRIRDNSYVDCLTCIRFMLNEERWPEYSCQLEGDTADENFFSDIRNQYNPSALTMINILKSPITLKNIPLWTWDSIRMLNISGNLVNKINSGFFLPFRNMFILDLSKNNLTSVTNGEFMPLIELQILNLSENNINELSNDSFISLVDLFEIDLSYNRIKYIPTDLFKNQGHLEIVLLNNNEITSFEYTFMNITPFSLPSLDLSWNKIETLQLRGNFKSLCISHNNLSEFSTNVGSSLESLNLSYNNIEKIDEFTMLKATKLKSLDLSNNFLQFLPTSSFRNQKLLEFIDISNNRLSKNKYGSQDNWISFFLNFDHLNSVSLDNNMWTCADLKDILHSLNSRLVNVIPGNEHVKSNILGISCIDPHFNSTSNLTNLQPEIITYIVNKVLNEVRENYENNTNIEKEMSNISSRMNELEKSFASKIVDLEIKLNKLSVNNDSLVTETSEIESRVLNSVFSRIKDFETQINNNFTKNIEKEMFKISSRVNELEKLIISKNTDLAIKLNTPNIQNDTLVTETSKIESKILNSVFSRIHDFETKMNYNFTKKDNSSLNDIHTSQIVQNEATSNLIDPKFSNLNKINDDIVSQKNEEYMTKTKELLQTVSDGANAVSGVIIQNLLLFSIVCILIYFVYVYVRRNAFMKRDMVNLVQV